MWIDLLPELPQNGGYRNVITALHVISRYALDCPVSNLTAANTSEIIFGVMMRRHLHLPMLMITDKGLVFDSNMVLETADVLGISLRHASTKHPQTFEVLERTHATIKTSPRKATGKICNYWHKHLPLAILNYITTYHTSIGCEPRRIFHGRVPSNLLESKLD